MSDAEFIVFKKHKEGTLIQINILLDNEQGAEFSDLWFNKVESCQAPLIETFKNGFNLHLPWILKKENDS